MEVKKEKIRMTIIIFMEKLIEIISQELEIMITLKKKHIILIRHMVTIKKNMMIMIFTERLTEIISQELEIIIQKKKVIIPM